MPAPALAVMRVRQQARDEPVVGIGRRIVDERGDFLGRRQQPGEVERNAADQRRAIGLRRVRDPFALQPREDELVDRIVRPRALLHRRRRRGLQRLKRPVPLVLRALRDPLAKGRDLLRGQRRPLALRRRHLLLRIVRQDAHHQLALVRVARHDRADAVVIRHRLLAQIEPPLAVAMLLIRPVAEETGVRKDRPDVLVEPDGLRHRRARAEHARRAEENGKESRTNHGGTG